MSTEVFAIGGWKLDASDPNQGLHIFKNGEEVQHLWPNIRIGCQVYDENRKVDYICEEYGDGKGGYVTAVRLSDGEVLSHVETFGIDPTHCAVSKDGKYLVVAHHGAPTPESGDAPNSCPINLYTLNDDGSIKERVDRMLILGGEKKAQLHSVYCSPSGNFFLINECGQDMVMTMVIENDRMRIVDKEEGPKGYCPRYGCWNKTLPFFYGNNENEPILTTYEYKEDGTVKRVSDLSLLVGDEPHSEAVVRPNGRFVPAYLISDIVMTPNGKFMYILIRRIGRLVAIAIDEKGVAKVIQSTPNGSPMPRGLAISPDGKKLYVCNADINELWTFNIAEDGTVADSGDHKTILNCGNMIVTEE